MSVAAGQPDPLLGSRRLCPQLRLDVGYVAFQLRQLRSNVGDVLLESLQPLITAHGRILEFCEPLVVNHLPVVKVVYDFNNRSSFQFSDWKPSSIVERRAANSVLWLSMSFMKVPFSIRSVYRNPLLCAIPLAAAARSSSCNSGARANSCSASASCPNC